MQLLGIHHVSALTADIKANLQFYTGVLGMRLVKKTVNQDDPGTYHLFYADEGGTPGTDLTFFDLPLSRRLTPGTNSISHTALRVRDTAALAYWQGRFTAHDVEQYPLRQTASRTELPFRDPEGQRLSLVADDGEPGVAGGTPWMHSPVPQKYGIIGLGPTTLTVSQREPTVAVLTDILGFRPAGEYEAHEGPQRFIGVFATGAGGPGAEVHVDERTDLERERLGHGGVHHVAFRVPDDEGLLDAWARRIREAGFATTGPIDRYYFGALYFREPNGILFELSTDGPGFTTDEPFATLGEKLALPPFLEGRRAEIEARLKPLPAPVRRT